MRRAASTGPAAAPRRALVSLCVMLAALPCAAAAPKHGQNVPFPPAAPLAARGPVPQSAYAAVRWRLIGPFRGGSATMAADGPVLDASLQRLAALAGRWHATLSRTGGLNRRLHRAGLAMVRVP